MELLEVQTTPVQPETYLFFLVLSEELLGKQQVTTTPTGMEALK